MIEIIRNPEPATEPLRERWRYGNAALLEAPVRVFIEPADPRDRTTAEVCDALADCLARKDVVVLAGTDGEAWQAMVTATTRHAGPCIMLGSRPLVKVYQGYLNPVPAARVWDERFDEQIHIYLEGAGLLKVGRRLATHVVRVAPPFDRSFRASDVVEKILR